MALMVVVTVMILAVGLLVMGFMVIVYRKVITRPVGKLTTVLEAMARGDLTQRAGLTTTDELGSVGVRLDESLDRSEERGELLGLDAATLVEALKDQYDNLATSLDRHNVQEFLPELFESLEQPHIVQVQRLRSHHRPVSHYTT